MPSAHQPHRKTRIKPGVAHAEVPQTRDQAAAAVAAKCNASRRR